MTLTDNEMNEMVIKSQKAVIDILQKQNNELAATLNNLRELSLMRIEELQELRSRVVELEIKAGKGMSDSVIKSMDALGLK